MSNLILQAFSEGDVFLINKPEINVFKYKYYRFTNFALKTKQVSLSSHADFNSSIHAIIPKSGHFLSNMHLCITLPQLNKIDGDYLCWNDNIGMTIFEEPVTLSIGGNIVDRMYPEFNDIFDTLSSFENKNKMQLTLKSDIIASCKMNATREIELCIPLNFFFTKASNLALPLIAMPFQEIKIDFKLKKFKDLIHYNGTAPPDYSVIASSLHVEYVDFDEIIAPELMDTEYTYVIEQVQFQNEPIPSNVNNYNALLKFYNPCKELVFAFVQDSSLASNNYYTFNASNETAIMKSASLLFNGAFYHENLPETYYRTVFPSQYHSVIPLKFVYCIPFCKSPEHTQPTGRVNLDAIDNVSLNVTLNDNVGSCFLRVYAITHNIVTIKNGLFSLGLTY
jgi:hypothetical protein